MKRTGLMYKTFIATLCSNGVIATIDIIIGLFFVFKEPLMLFLAPLTTSVAGPLVAWCFNIVTTHADMGAFYFLSHGIVKLFLVWGLWHGKLWAYPVSIAFLTGFTVYQAFTLTQTYSAFVFVLMIINIAVIAIISAEYRIIRKHRK
jgi:uncharacterized membrane protein